MVRGEYGKKYLAVVMIVILSAGMQNAFADASVNVVSFSTLGE